MCAIFGVFLVELQYIFKTKKLVFINFLTATVLVMMSLEELQMSFLLCNAAKIPLMTS